MVYTRRHSLTVNLVWRIDLVPTLVAPARGAYHGRARHILAHTLPQTISRCDLSLSSSRRHIDPAAIAWSQPWRPCATPNMPVPSPCSSLDRAIFGIVIFAASWTLGVRFQWPGVPKIPFARLVDTRRHCLTVGLAVRAARCQHGKGKSSQILDPPCMLEGLRVVRSQPAWELSRKSPSKSVYSEYSPRSTSHGRPRVRTRTPRAPPPSGGIHPSLGRSGACSSRSVTPGLARAGSRPAPRRPCGPRTACPPCPGSP